MNISKKSVFLGVFVLLVLLGLPFLSYAEQPENHYAKINLEPYYRSQISGGTNVTYTVSIKTPSGIRNISSAILQFQMFIAPSMTYSAWVNQQACKNPQFITGVGLSLAQGVATFDCSNIITTEGMYNVTFRAVGLGVGATTAWMEISFINDPLGSMKISGTDYEVGDNGKTFVQILDAGGVNIDNATCLVKVWYPNSTLLLDFTAMTHLDDGIYYYDFTAPNTTGIYPISITCDYLTSAPQYNASTGTRITGGGGGGISNTNLVDGTFFDMAEQGGSGNSIAVNFSFDNIIIPNTTIDYNILLTAQRTQGGLDPASDPILISLYNWSSHHFIVLPSQFSYTSGVASFVYTVLNNVTSDFVNPSINGGQAWVQINDTATGLGDLVSTTLRIDQLNIRVDSSAGQTSVQTTKGSGEWNVRRHFTEVMNNVNSNSAVNNNTNTIVNQTQITVLQINNTVNSISQNQSIIINQLSSMNTTLNNTLLMVNQINTTINDIKNMVQSINDTSNVNNQYLRNITITLGQVNTTINGLGQNQSIIMNQLSSMNTTLNNTLLTVNQINNTVNNISTGIQVLQISSNNMSNQLLIMNQTLYTLQNQTLQAIGNISLNVNLTNITRQLNTLINTTDFINLTTLEIYDLTGLIAQYVINQSITLQQINNSINGIGNNVSLIRNTLQNITVSLATIQSSINDVSIDINELQNSMFQVKNNLSYLISLQLNDTDMLDFTNLTNQINNVQNSINQQSITINTINTTTNNIYSSLQDHISDENQSEIIELSYLQNITLSLNNLEFNLTNVQMNLSGLNLTELNNSITGFIAEENAKPRTYTLASVLLIFLIIILLTGIWVREKTFYLITAIYCLCIGIVLYSTFGLWFLGLMFGLFCVYIIGGII